MYGNILNFFIKYRISMTGDDMHALDQRTRIDQLNSAARMQ